MMGLFDNLVFESFDFLLEGEQAEAYKKRKAEEKAAKEKADKERGDRRYGDDRYGSKHYRNATQRKLMASRDSEKEDIAIDRYTDDSRRANKAATIGNKDYYSGKRARNSEENRTAIDAANHHIRRHSKNESVYDDYE